ncbi:MAG: hypothetical protein HZA90_20100 [Verrucomicrobia bacterium]|nr:hypothetical protein [Verrucomicrobiota bacterium]
MSTHTVLAQSSDAGDSLAAAAPSPIRSACMAHAAGRSGKSDHESRLAPAQVLPAPAICRARGAGFGDYVDCLVEPPFKCPHALGFGYAFLCQHPQRSEIVEHTAAHAQ